MDESTGGTTSTQGIDLAEEPDFDLGLLRVHPSKCEVEWNGDTQVLQRRVMQVLVALAGHRGSVVSQDDLVRRCWRGLSVSDDAIFRCISQLRKLAVRYPGVSYSIETIPGVGYRLTSSNSVGDHGPVEPIAANHPRIRIAALAAAAALTASILAGAVIWTGHRGTKDHQSLRVTVQPFEALGKSADAGSLARRIPNEIVNQLGDSQVETVLGDSQALNKGAKTTSSQTGFIVTGIVRDDPRNATVDVRIEDGTTRDALWSNEFKRDSREASDLPAEVAARIADVVSIAIFARTANPPLTDESAVSALLQLQDMIRDTPEGAWAQMVERGQGIVARHPDFAFGHSVLAEAYTAAAEGIDDPLRARAMDEAARREANLTLKLDPQDAGAYAVLSELEPRYSYRAREAILLRGLRVARHPKEPLGALYKYEGVLLDDVGRLNEGLTLQLIAQATDEWGAPKTVKLVFAYANMGNLAAARGWLQKAVQRWPNHSAVRDVRKYIAGFYEQPAAALAVFDLLDQQASSGEDTTVWRTFVKAKAAHSQQVTDAAIQRIGRGADEGNISRETEIMMLAALGRNKQAMDAANRAVDHQRLQPWFLFTPVARDLRKDPGFFQLASRMGLVRYWHDTGKRPDFCTGGDSECSPQLLAALKR